MGIPTLWSLIKEQDLSVPIAQLAEEHYRRHGRPLRIAVDEADWRFNNLTAQQVYIIREKSNEPAFQGIEKSIFYRICRLLTLNMQLLFVFDGPKRPWKWGRRGQGKIDYEKRRLLQEMLQYFQIPCHEAPGEAEAECARLQRLGVVDAVWSQDSDTLMFGCDFLIRDDRIAKEKGIDNRSKENTKKNRKTVKVVRGHELQAKHGLDREGLVLYAMLAGGDYDAKGLEGCGSTLAIQAVEAGLGKGLCNCQTREDAINWREQLVAWMPESYHGLVPLDYPNIKTLEKYNRPTISTDEQLLNLRSLRNGWDQPIRELELLELTSSRFNIWARQYMDKVGPILLTKHMAMRDSSLARENPHRIKLTKQRAKKADDQPSLEGKLTFSPFGLTSLQRKDFEGKRAGYWNRTMDQPFEPDYRVECELPVYLLEKHLPLEILNSPPSEQKRKRKRQMIDNEYDLENPFVPSNQERSSEKGKHIRDEPIPPSPSCNFSTQKHTRSETSRLQQVVGSRVNCPTEIIDLSLDEDDEELFLNKSLAKRTRVPFKRVSVASVIDLGSSSEDSEDEEDQLREAILRSVQRSVSSNEYSHATTGNELKPGTIVTWPEQEADLEDLFVPSDSPSQIGNTAKLGSLTREGVKVSMHNQGPLSNIAVTEPNDLTELRAKRLQRSGEHNNQSTDHAYTPTSDGNLESLAYSPMLHRPSRLLPKIIREEEIECIDLTDV